MKPGDLVEPDWGFHADADYAPELARQIGLVLSHPKEEEGRLLVKVNWLGYELEEYYSARHLRLVSGG